MAAAPQFKVYDHHGTYQASCKELEACAALMAFYGAGATIRYQHGRPVWSEGDEDQLAAESYDHVAEVAYARIQAARSKR